MLNCLKLYIHGLRYFVEISNFSNSYTVTSCSLKREHLKAIIVPMSLFHCNEHKCIFPSLFFCLQGWAKYLLSFTTVLLLNFQEVWHGNNGWLRFLGPTPNIWPCLTDRTDNYFFYPWLNNISPEYSHMGWLYCSADNQQCFGHETSW